MSGPATPPFGYWCARAWLPTGLARDVLVEVSEGRMARVTPGAPPPPHAQRLPGLVLPGLANAHSHAFHRALRGRTHRGTGDFWSWRAQMYGVAERLDPDRYLRLARACYAEMALAGVTTVGEFHYLHHAPEGRPYDDPNAMGHALVEAAGQAGVRLTLLDACYLQGDVDGTRLSGVQRRFGDGTADAWAARVEGLRAPRVGAAVHSVRACPPRAMSAVAAWAGGRGAPVHLHLSEQQRENDACRAVHGVGPTRLAHDTGVLGPRTTAVHATHLTDEDVTLLAGSGTGVCLCPTTERDLADGIGPAALLASAGVPLSLGSDSQAVVDLLEEARAVEMDDRLASRVRGHHRAADLLRAATEHGTRALGWPDAGRIEPGQRADLVSVRLDTPRLAGAPLDDDLLAAVVFSATAADVSDVVVDGAPVVADGRHLRLDDVATALDEAVREAVAT